jgi:hypothetical protein
VVAFAAYGVFTVLSLPRLDPTWEDAQVGSNTHYVSLFGFMIYKEDVTGAGGADAGRHYRPAVLFSIWRRDSPSWWKSLYC